MIMPSATGTDDFHFLEEAEEGARRRIMFLGATDTGKTHLVLAVADVLRRKGRIVGVLDLDLGQSTVGPPGCAGLQLPWEAGSDPLFPTAMVFLGFLSPALGIGPVVEASLRLEKRAAEMGYEDLLIDTSGMVEGGLAGLLKRSKIRALRPDLLVVLERQEETRHIFRSLESSSYGKQVRLQPSPQARRRSRSERAEYRQERFRRYFREAREWDLDLGGVEVLAASPRVAPDPEGWREGQLLGLNDEQGYTMALAVYLGKDGKKLRVSAPPVFEPEGVASVVAGSFFCETEDVLRAG